MNRLLTALILADAAGAQTIAVTNARIFPVTAQPIESGTLLIRDGKIAELGARVVVPKGAQKIDGTGLSIYPGWIDGLAQAGLAEIASVRRWTPPRSARSIHRQRLGWR
jgi:imidazolonepropionase-like amidohydrolase